MDKKIEQPTEKYEEFDYLSDFYFPLKEVEDKYSSPILQRLRENEIDPHEFLGIEKVEGTGVVKRIEDKADLEEGKKTFGQSFIDFVKDAPEAAAVSTAEAGVNLSNNLVQLFGAGSNMVFKGSEKGDGISQATTEFAQGYNKSSEEIIAKLTQYTEDNDVNGVSQLMTDIGIDIAATIPIQRMLKKTGVPSYVATPLSFGLVYGMTGGDEEAENNMFIDSETIHGLNEVLGVLPDTPESEIAELVATTFEGTAWGALGDRLIKVFKVLKNNVPAYMNQQTSVSMGGSAIAGEGALRVQENAEENLNVENENLGEEKKTLNFDEDNQISSPMPGDDEMASAGFGAVFKSILKETAKKLPAKGNGEQFLGQLKNTPGLKQQELKWSGLDDFLKNKKNVTKDEIQEYLKLNSLDVAEVKFGGQMSKLSDDVENARNEFERKWLLNEERRLGEKINPQEADLLLRNNLNYDQVEMFNTGTANYLTVPFDMFETYFGRELERGLIKPNKIFKGPEGQNFKITELDLEKFATEKLIRTERKMGTAPKFGEHTEPGGEDYTELVFKIKQGGMDKGIPSEISATMLGDKFLPKKIVNTPYKNPSHMNVKSEIAHVRFKSRDLNGQKVLTVEEMQSDFATAVKKAQFTTPGFDDVKPTNITDFPFKNTWYELTTKRLIRYAADNGFDAVAIPKGSVSAKRYREEIDKVTKLIIQKNNTSVDGEEYIIRYFDEKGMDVAEKVFKKENLQKLEKEIGPKKFKELLKLEQTKKLKDNTGEAELLLDKEIILGSGKGKVQLYDKAIPSFLKKYGKKWDAKVYDEEISMDMDDLRKLPVTIIQLTDDMKKSVQQDGQALFEIFGIGSATAVGANVVSDSMKNNTISQKTN